MTKYPDVMQGSEEWASLRYGKVGGSSAKDLNANEGKPIRDNAIYDKILAAKFEEFFDEESFKSAAMDRGNEYEPYARQEFERVFNVTVEQIGWAEMDNRLIGISPDGLIGTDEAIEIKCPSAATHMKYLRNNNEFIETYVWQLVHNFLVLGVKKIRCISYRPENMANPLLVFDVTPETVVRVSAKKTCAISELVIQSQIRCNELIRCIEEDVKLFSKNNF